VSKHLECPEPGVYRGVDFGEYLRWDAASNSQLGILATHTPAHLKAYLDEPPKPTKALKEGRSLHAAVLEPEVFRRDFRTAQQCGAQTSKGDRCSKPGNWPTKRSAWLCTTHLQAAERAGQDPGIDEDVVTMTGSEYAMVTACRDAILGHPTAAGFLLVDDAETEVSVVWDEEVAPGAYVRCKGRWDLYSSSLGTVMDVKGARDAGVRQFARDAYRYGYFRQAAMYLSAAKTLGLRIDHYAIVAVEKTPPYALMIHRITEDAIGHLPEPGEPAFHTLRHVRALLRIYARCRETDTWPGYPERPHDLTLDDWQWSDMDIQTRRLEEHLHTDDEEQAA